MLRLVVLTFLVALACGAKTNHKSDDTRIVGGRDVTIEEYPWQITLRRKASADAAFRHSCGGSILNANVVLTAAHCVLNRNPKEYVVIAGTTNKSGGDGVLSRVTKFVTHERYNGSIYDNDVALIKLESPLPLNKHSIVPVSLTSEAPEEGDVVTISGWGALKEGGSSPEILQAVDIPIVSNEYCSGKYDPSPILESMICAGIPIGGKDSCQGDSGGPLTIRNVQYGIVSWGRGCARADYPGVYSSVANLRSWIDENVEKLLKE